MKRGNGAFNEHRYGLALEYYKKAIAENPILDKILAYNIGYVEKKLKHTLKVLVVFHVFHNDVISECIQGIQNIPAPYDVLVTTPLHENSPAVRTVRSAFPNARIDFCENRGRDMAPFVKNWPLISKYELCCKVHTKKGDPDYAEAWKDLLLDGIFGTRNEIAAMVQEFQRDPNVAIAGNELLYAPHPLFIGNNGPNIEKICKSYSVPRFSHGHDGFFMGSMFWIRPSSFPFAERLVNLEFEPETGENDEKPEHALERIFGSMTLSDEKKILLIWRNQEKIPSFQKVSSDHETRMLAFKQYFDAIESARKVDGKIEGDICTVDDPSVGMLNGWLAIRGDVHPREAKVIIDDHYHIDVMCHTHRDDLIPHKINQGNHGFFIQIPSEFLDCREHEYKLYDKATGQLVTSISCMKKSIVSGGDE